VPPRFFCVIRAYEWAALGPLSLALGNHKMDYRIIKNPAILDSTGYIEIGKYTYSGKHRQKDFIFIDHEAFNITEGIIQHYFKEYVHYNTNNISRPT
jgi:hypothetical protein